jgi:hypothetical protein
MGWKPESIHSAWLKHMMRHGSVFHTVAIDGVLGLSNPGWDGVGELSIHWLLHQPKKKMGTVSIKECTTSNPPKRQQL